MTEKVKEIKLCDGFEIYANGKFIEKVEDLKDVFDYFNLTSDMKDDFLREMFCFGSVSITCRTWASLNPVNFKVVAIPCKD